MPNRAADGSEPKMNNASRTPLRFGIIGCGMIAEIHAKALQSLEEAVLLGVCDHSIERAEAFARQHGVSAYRDTQALLDDPQIDAVCICTPSGFHAEGAAAALEHGKHVILEKPMALTCASAEQILKACRQSGRLLTVISQLRFYQDIQTVRNLIREGRFGRLTMCSLYMKYWREESYYTSSPWKGTFRFDGGGALMNQGIHGIDLLQYLAGPFRVESGCSATLSHKIEVEDTAAALIRFECGALGVIEASTCTYPGFPRRIEIIGDRGHVILKENSIEQLHIDGKAVRCAASDADFVRTASDPTALDYTLHARQIQNLIRAVRGEEKLLVDAEEGAKAIRIIEEIYAHSGNNAHPQT